MSNPLIHLTAPSDVSVAPFSCRAYALAWTRAVIHWEAKDLNFISAKSLVEANPVDKRGAENWEAGDQPSWWLTGLMTTHQHTIKCHIMKNPHCLAINPFPSWAVSLSSALLKATELFRLTCRGLWTMWISGREPTPFQDGAWEVNLWLQTGSGLTFLWS